MTRAESNVPLGSRRRSARPWLGPLLLLAAAGCGSPRTLELECDLPVPVLITPPLAIDGTRLAEDPLDEEYAKNVTVGRPTPASIAADPDGPRWRITTELGRSQLFGRNYVANASVYVGRYDGLIVIIPVGNTYLGVEGEVFHARPSPPRDRAASAAEEGAQ